MNKDFIAKISIIINSKKDKVWDALINPEAIKNYMFGTNVVSEWKEGSPITWEGEWQGKSYKDKGVIQKIEPKENLQYTHYSPLSGIPDLPENYNSVSFELSENEKGTLVSLTQDNNATEKARDHSEKNWEMMLKSLKDYVEKKS